MTITKQSVVRQSPWTAGVFELVAVFAGALATAFKSLATNDIGFYDETAYLASGLAQADGVWSRFTDGATYSDYYF